jgi:hypothetical protein
VDKAHRQTSSCSAIHAAAEVGAATTYFVYVLRLTGDNFYVGLTSGRPSFRIAATWRPAWRCMD